MPRFCNHAVVCPKAEVVVLDMDSPPRKQEQEPSNQESNIQLLLAGIKDAIEQGSSKAALGCLDHLAQCLSMTHPKMHSRRPLPTSAKGGPLGYRPEFMLCSVLLADKLSLDCT